MKIARHRHPNSFTCPFESLAGSIEPAPTLYNAEAGVSSSQEETKLFAERYPGQAASLRRASRKQKTAKKSEKNLE
jgi:hypothetical protein